jgi:hypothetical protein
MQNVATLEAKLRSRFGQPEPTPEEWHEHYVPEQVAQYAAELEDLEAQLDLGLPGWRERKPFNKLPIEKLAWCKLRMLRRTLILEGRGAMGVRIGWKQEGPDNRFPVAQPVRPKHARTAPQFFAPLVSLPQLANAYRITIPDLEAQLRELPSTVRDVRGWLRDRLGQGVPDKPRLPSRPSAPLSDSGSGGAA